MSDDKKLTSQTGDVFQKLNLTSIASPIVTQTSGALPTVVAPPSAVTGFQLRPQQLISSFGLRLANNGVAVPMQTPTSQV